MLHMWFLNNGMLLNESKCQFLIIESAKIKRNDIVEIEIHNKKIVQTKKGKLLVVTIDCNLTMKNHIKNICKQAGNKLNALATIPKYLDENKRILLMNFFVISQLNYSPIIWDVMSTKLQ